MASFSDTDAEDLQKLGKIGTLEGTAAEYAPIWRIVSKARVPLSDIERNWTFDRMMAFCSYLDMENDYRSAWGEYYQQQRSKPDNG
ncbi:hypothetical protein B7992_13225 [Fibrobacter sp. UWH1]|nr:hypothetical protein B7992_13225 [Fibrobacter sp. UWH1]